MHTIFKTINCTIKTNPLPILHRFCSHPFEQVPQALSAVRVRFAPSPTGYLHLGGLRTALYNYLFARANRGTFLLRIEDTDQSRLVPGAAEQLCTDLEWAGIRPDEGPPYGGRYGPYVQSERLDTYRSEVRQLLENGSAYYCFCTESRLELLRREAVRTRQIPRYDNRCRDLTPGQIAVKLAKQISVCIRFKLDPLEGEYNDMVFGQTKYNVSEQEGDFVIIKSDGYPTYHFAHVVDDHLMKISHVLRGVEWQISTTKHMQLYKAFGWRPPQYGHLPLLVNADGTKLSKRQGNINISHYRQEMGVRPQALINYITLTGGGFTRHAKPHHYTMKELQEIFDISKIRVNSGRLNPELLDQCNRLNIQHDLNDPNQVARLIAETKTLIQKAYPKSDNLHLDDKHIASVLNWSVNRITKLEDLMSDDMQFLWVLPKKVKDLMAPTTAEVLAATLEQIEFVDKDQLVVVLKRFADGEDVNYSRLMKMLRTVLSGIKVGPGVAEMMVLLGKQSTLHRIRRYTAPTE